MRPDVSDIVKAAFPRNRPHCSQIIIVHYYLLEESERTQSMRLFDDQVRSYPYRMLIQDGLDRLALDTLDISIRRIRRSGNVWFRMDRREISAVNAADFTCVDFPRRLVNLSVSTLF